MREWAGNSRVSANLIRLHAPNSPNRARELPKVFDHIRENSRFGETKVGDFGSNGHCVLRTVVVTSS